MIIVDKPLLASVKLIFVVPSRFIPLSDKLSNNSLSTSPERTFSNSIFSSSVSAL